MLTLTSFESWFAPTCVVAKAGTTLSVTVKNIGKALHNVTIESLKFKKDIRSGDSLHLKVTIPEHDSILFFCKYHLMGGMQGAFVPAQP
jgi:plastocyanin